MLLFEPYQVIIFDFDGVLVDSNRLKVEAMRTALRSCGYFSDELVAECTANFAANFGKSRYHHIERFCDYLDLQDKDLKGRVYDFLLEGYAAEVQLHYPEAPLAEGIDVLLPKLAQKKLFIASGSEQQQLRDVAEAKGLAGFFRGIYGSPTRKPDIIKDILQQEHTEVALMVGDAFADYEAAEYNNIDFCFYSPLSLVGAELTEFCFRQGVPVIQDYRKVISC
jgi:HAD superfamily hydrolase (TIGR01549 family)